MFPNFNIYSTPLLILVFQGLLFAFLLLGKYTSKKTIQYLFLALVLLITCWHRTTYTIGFMGWYDTFRNTKVNYYLISLGLATGPLLWLYIKSVINKNFTWYRKLWIHFTPVVLYIIFKLLVLLYDRSQPGYADTQNGQFMQTQSYAYINIAWGLLTFVHQIAYTILALGVYRRYRQTLVQQYSDTYKYELRWIRNCIYLYLFLLVYAFLQMITDGLFSLHWTQEWWYEIISAIVIVYLGIKGFFTPLDTLPDIDFNIRLKNEADTEATNHQSELQRISEKIATEKLYLDPSLNLTQLAMACRTTPSNLSSIINSGGSNFNNYINQFRLNEVKHQFADPDNDNLTILAIALDAGFNSKATFNRVFKKLEGRSPSDYRKSS